MTKPGKQKTWVFVPYCGETVSFCKRKAQKMKKHKNKEAVEFLRRFLSERNNVFNCMWVRQVMREEGFSNGQIRCAVKTLGLVSLRCDVPGAYARSFDGWMLPVS